MAKKFYVFIDRGCISPEGSTVEVFATSEEVQAYLLENGEDVDSDPEHTWVIFGERFGFEASRVPTAFRLKGPEEGKG